MTPRALIPGPQDAGDAQSPVLVLERPCHVHSGCLVLTTSRLGGGGGGGVDGAWWAGQGLG